MLCCALAVDRVACSRALGSGRNRARTGILRTHMAGVTAASRCAIAGYRPRRFRRSFRSAARGSDESS